MRRHTPCVVRLRHRSAVDSTAVVGDIHRSRSIVGPIKRMQYDTRDMRCKRHGQSQFELRVRAIGVDRRTVVQRSEQLPLVGRVKNVLHATFDIDIVGPLGERRWRRKDASLLGDECPTVRYSPHLRARFWCRGTHTERQQLSSCS